MILARRTKFYGMRARLMTRIPVGTSQIGRRYSAFGDIAKAPALRCCIWDLAEFINTGNSWSWSSGAYLKCSWNMANGICASLFSGILLGTSRRKMRLRARVKQIQSMASCYRTFVNCIHYNVRLLISYQEGSSLTIDQPPRIPGKDQPAMSNFDNVIERQDWSARALKPQRIRPASRLRSVFGSQTDNDSSTHRRPLR